MTAPLKIGTVFAIPATPSYNTSFLAALENSNSVGEQAGWLPQHITVHEDDNLVAIMPLYKKNSLLWWIRFRLELGGCLPPQQHRVLPKTA